MKLWAGLAALLFLASASAQTPGTFAPGESTGLSAHLNAEFATKADTAASAATATATGTPTARTLAARAADIVNVKDFGAKGDTRIATPTVTLGAGSASLTVSPAQFAAADVGKAIIIASAGTAPTTGPVETVATATPGSGYGSIPSCAVTDASGSGSGATCGAIMAVQSATVTTGGAGCTDGSAVFLAGTDGTGTPAQITGTVAAGVLSGALTITSAGMLSVLGAVSGASVYGADCATAPTVALSYGVAATQITAIGAAYSTTQTTVALTGGAPSVAATLGTPLIGAPVPPLRTTIAAYGSGTQVTLAAPAVSAVSGTANVLWGTNDATAFQAALTAGARVLVPTGIYWIGGTLDPGIADLSISGQGLESTILVYDSGTSVSYETGVWTPLLKNITGVPTSLKGSIQIEDMQFRGLLDFGRVNTGAAALELNNYTALHIDRAKFYQMPFMAMQNESIADFLVANSVFDTVLRDQARCRSCFSGRIIGNRFVHSDDDTVAFHQANYITAPGTVREGLVVEGNMFEDVQGISLIGGRLAIVRGNVFRRIKTRAVSVSYTSVEGIDQIRGIDISDNIATDTMARNGLPSAGSVFSVSFQPANAPGGVSNALVGSNVKGTTFTQKPWEYDLGSVVPGAGFAPAVRGVNIHDNQTMRTLPDVAHYSDWGFGRLLSPTGFIDPPVIGDGLRPTAGVSASINTPSLQIHHNDIQDVRRGVVLNDTAVSSALSGVSISFNHIYNAWEYGIVTFGTGGIGFANIMGNVVDVDPYQLSPGRNGGHGGWSSGYTVSKCLSFGYNVPVQLAFNTFSNCYTAQTSTGWVITSNIVRGAPWSGLTGQPTSYSSSSFGVAVYPANIGGQWYLSNVVSDPSANGPGALGAPANTHVTSAAAAPAAGWHVTGDMIFSTDPTGCACVGWKALTTGSAWVAGTDYKVVPLT